ncbi:alpha/beta hydrolase [Streptomyces aidingensis]|uniref:Alpha/beta hydrolase fold n=1 Tax=Streptomyces aidingensis TaxID=910347 RepID=A0A1I1EWL9_9ACTN|nr:alpha/beta hydrolase [Streptomyces aidingensis]SFB91545.1 alpha/beta hydrolase fold [Streptomyces aidingensis]
MHLRHRGPGRPRRRIPFAFPARSGARARARRARGRARAAWALPLPLLLTACFTDGGEEPGTPRATDSVAESTPAAQAYPGMPDAIAQQRLSWVDCEEPTVLQGGGEDPGELADGTPWQCTTLTVPLDYDAPDGETIELALIRAVSPAEPADRIGSLLINFGGPGASGVATLPLAAEDFEDLRDGYDLVGFDPRGVGGSAGVVCLDAEATDAAGQELGSPPDTEAELELHDELNEEYIAACEANSGDVLPHLNTANTARDLDLMRHVLGDTKLHYLGFSYGTELGAVYASLFPENVGRAVFDAVVDPTAEDSAERALHQAAGFQLALENYMADCADTEGDACPTGAGGAEGTELLTGFLDSLADSPIDGDGERELTQNLALTGIVATLYDQETWQYLTLGLRAAMEEGDGSLLLAFADLYNGRGESGEYSNQNDAHTTISCNDDPAGLGREAVEQHRAAFEEASPVFGPYLVWAVEGCTGWPVTEESESYEQVGIDATGSAEILLIGTTGDPATPYEGTERMRDALGAGVGVMITYDGEGHGAYGNDECIDDAVEEYLLAGLIPQDGLVCG